MGHWVLDPGIEPQRLGRAGLHAAFGAAVELRRTSFDQRSDLRDFIKNLRATYWRTTAPARRIVRQTRERLEEFTPRAKSGRTE
jgi:hypothetical protein